MRKKFDERFLELKYESGLCQEIDCTDEENETFLEMIERDEELPVGVARREMDDGTKLDKFYKVVPLKITSEEIQEYCTLRNMKNIKTIKNCVVFFTVLVIISLVLSLFTVFSQLK